MIIQIETTEDRKRPKIDIILDPGEECPDADQVRAEIYSASVYIGNHLPRASIHRITDDGAEEVNP